MGVMGMLGMVDCGKRDGARYVDVVLEEGLEVYVTLRSALREKERDPLALSTSRRSASKRIARALRRDDL